MVYSSQYEINKTIICNVNFKSEIVEQDTATLPLYRDFLYIRCRDCILASSLRERVAYSDVMCLILAGSKAFRSRAAKAKKKFPSIFRLPLTHSHVKAGEGAGQRWMSESEMILVKFPSGFKAAALCQNERPHGRRHWRSLQEY